MEAEKAIPDELGGILRLMFFSAFEQVNWYEIAQEQIYHYKAQQEPRPEESEEEPVIVPPVDESPNPPLGFGDGN